MYIHMYMYVCIYNIYIYILYIVITHLRFLGCTQRQQHDTPDARELAAKSITAQALWSRYVNLEPQT